METFNGHIPFERSAQEPKYLVPTADIDFVMGLLEERQEQESRPDDNFLDEISFEPGSIDRHFGLLIAAVYGDIARKGAISEERQSVTVRRSTLRVIQEREFVYTLLSSRPPLELLGPLVVHPAAELPRFPHDTQRLEAQSHGDGLSSESNLNVFAQQSNVVFLNSTTPTPVA